MESEEKNRDEGLLLVRASLLPWLTHSHSCCCRVELQLATSLPISLLISGIRITCEERAREGRGAAEEERAAARDKEPSSGNHEECFLKGLITCHSMRGKGTCEHTNRRQTQERQGEQASEAEKRLPPLLPRPERDTLLTLSLLVHEPPSSHSASPAAASAADVVAG